MKRITHQQARNMLQDLVDHPLTSRSQAQLDAHLTECGDCRQNAEHLHLLENNLRRIMRERWRGQPAKISIVSIQTRSRRLRVRNKLWNSVKMLAAIALLATFLFVVNSFLHQPGSFSASANHATQESITDKNVSPSPTSEFQTTPTVFVKTTTSSEWVASTDFGKLVLSMDASGTRITKISYQFAGWKCGSTPYSGETVDATGWLISDGKFSVITTFDPKALTHIYMDGTYDKTNQKLSGTWDFVSSVTTNNCSGSGTWEALAQTQAAETSTPASPQAPSQTFRFGDPVESAPNALIAAQSALKPSFNYIEPLKVIKVEQMSYGEYKNLIKQPLNQPPDLKVWLVVFFNNQWQSNFTVRAKAFNDQSQLVAVPSEARTPPPPFRGCVSVAINAADGLPVEISGPIQAGILPECDQ